jgi:beta-glucanase (GH16 family)
MPLSISNDTLTFSDEFDTLSLNSSTSRTETWRPVYYWGDRTLGGNGEKELYVDPSWNNLGISAHRVDNGILSLTASRVPADLLDETGGLPYFSGLITSEQSFSQQYGYFEMRAQLPAGQGFWPAFWMVGIDSSWPPELDIMEAHGQHPTTLFTTAHTKQTGTHTTAGKATAVADMTTGMHTYGVDWQKDFITWYFDGQEVFKTATPADMHKPMYLQANLAVGGYWPGSPDATTPFPSAMQIDYIRAYQTAPDHTVVTQVPTSWTPITQKTFGIVDGTGATSTWSWTTNMSATQQKLKMEGDWARIAIGNGLDNWIEGSSAQYQEYDGNGGNDVLKGGAGIDVFKIDNDDGNDTILDFSNVNGNTDKVYLSGFHFQHFADVKPFLTQVGTDVILQLDADQALKFANTTIDKLAPEQFAFFKPVALSVGTPPITSVTRTGGAGNDTLAGGEGNDKLFGLAGDDALSGLGGNDTLVGGNGRDKLTGGAGADVFTFERTSDSTSKSKDTIADFMSGTDVIDLRGIDANTKVSGDQAFTFVGSSAFSGQAGQLRFASGILYGDVNGDKAADFVVAITGLPNLSATDFLL